MIKYFFIIFLKYGYLVSWMLKLIVKINIIKKLNCGKFKYIELNNILRK